MKNIIIFNNKDFGEIRVIDRKQEPWLIGKDIAEKLGYQNGSRDINRHVDSEDKLVVPIYDGTQNRNMTIINESGFYSLVLGSEMKQAKKFKRWVTKEVLPTIRKHGTYMTPKVIEETLTNPDFIIQLATQLKDEQSKRKVLEEETLMLEQRVAEYEPKISYLDTILSSKDTVLMTQIAADYGMSPYAMNRLLHELGVQYKVGKQWILYQEHKQQGYTKSHTHEIPMKDGTTKVVMNTRWTQKGRLAIYTILKENGILPQMEKYN